MSEKEQKSGYFEYNAHGHGLSAHFRRPFEHVLEVQAGTALPGTGGFDTSRAEDFHFKNVLSFKAAHTTVCGSHNPEDQTHTTLVATAVERLNILDLITADRIVGRLSSHYPPGGDEPVFTALGSHFDNLRIAGCPVEVHFDTEVACELGTFAAFKKRHDRDSAFRKTARERFGLGHDVPESLRQRYKGHSGKGLPESKGFVPCTLVKDIKIACPEVKRYGHVLVVPGVATISLAELHLSHGTRRLTMLRVDLGSPIAGVIVCGQGGSNGWPPSG